MVTSFARPQSIAFLALVIAGWLVLAGVPATPAASTQSLPHTLGPWSGSPLPLDRKVFAILETDDVSMMEYRIPQEPPVWMAHVSGFGNRAAFHPPELCYVGSHFDILERGPITVHVNGRPFEVMRLVIWQKNLPASARFASQSEAAGAQAGKRFEAWYWFTANGRVTPNYYRQQWWLALDTIRRHPTSGTLVRISTSRDDPTLSHRRLLTFVSFLDAALTSARAHGNTQRPIGS